jgi:hypothetical protein
VITFGFVPLIDPNSKSRGAIDIIDVKRKKFVQRLELKSSMHFSLPLIIGDLLIVTTRGGYAHLFAREVAWLDRWLKQSWFL